MTEPQARRFNWAVLMRSLRITTGLIMLAYAASHLLNLTLALHSIAWVEAASPYLSGAWTGVLAPVLVVSIVVHFLLALWSIYLRDTLRMSMHDMVQIGTGLIIIPLLVPHVFGIILAREIFGNLSYALILRVFWIDNPAEGLRQVVMVTTIWIHGCLGMFIWMRTKSWSGRVLNWLYPLTVAIPVLALLGYVEGGRVVMLESQRALYAVALAEQAVSGAQTPAPENGQQTEGSQTPTDQQSAIDHAMMEILVNPPPARLPGEEILPPLPAFESLSPEQQTAGLAALEYSGEMKEWVIRAFLLLGGLTLVARFVRLYRRRRGVVKIVYASGLSFQAKAGPTLLDLARLNDLPHANLCHGRGRCGTCRVRILSSDVPLAPAGELEQATLARFGSEENVRLACQLTPAPGRICISRVMPPDFAVRRRDEDLADAVEAV